MAKKKLTEPKVVRVIRPVLPDLYVDGVINMPSSMITTKEKFIKIWKGGTKGRDVEECWEKAKAWKDSHRK
jgi:hypothetical protein